MNSSRHQCAISKPALLCVSALIVLLDQWSKWLVEQKISFGQTVEVVPGLFNLIRVENTGMAFGLFPSHGALWGTVALGALGTLALVLVSFYFLSTPTSNTLLLTALALVLGGAVGNLIDRALLGAVTDFFDAYYGSRHFPTFNVADSAISVGIVLLAAESFLSPNRSPNETPLTEGSGTVAEPSS